MSESLAPPAGGAPAPASPLQLSPWRAEEAETADALIGRAFGPGRFAKTAERVRERAVFRPELSICAHFDGVLVGAVRLWRVHFGARAVLFLGPIAVEPAFRDHGVGSALVEAACAAAAAVGETAVVLVGDERFFGPLGFTCAPGGRLRLGGPVDPRRLFWKALAPGALDHLAGDLTG